MFKLAAALAAITTVASAMFCPGRLLAQDTITPVTPGPTPQKIDIPATSSHRADDDRKSADSTTDIVVPAGTAVDEINAYGRKVVVGGTVRHNIHVNNGQLVLLKGAHVRGKIEVANNSTVDNSSTCQVTIVNAPPVDAPAADTDEDSEDTRSSRKEAKSSAATVQKPLRSKPDWFAAQMALTILGMLGAALAAIIAPGASRKVADHISDNPKKDLRTGTAIGVAMLLIVLGDALLLKMPLIKYFWAPFGIMIAYAPVLLLGFGWIAGMRFAAEKLAAKLRWRKTDSLFIAISRGIIACGLLNVILGSISISLGVLGLFLELGFALMGLGGLASVTLKTASSGRY